MRLSELYTASHKELLAAGKKHGVKTGRRSMDRVRDDLRPILAALDTGTTPGAWMYYPPHARAGTGKWTGECNNPGIAHVRDPKYGQIAVSCHRVTLAGKVLPHRKICELIVDMLNEQEVLGCQFGIKDASVRSERRATARVQHTLSAQPVTQAG